MTDLEDRVTLLKTIADATRLRILGLLAERPHTGTELATTLSLSAPTISHHLHRLRDVGIVHAQVSLAPPKFGEAVEPGDFTVVGAVYDFRNDLGHGFGRVSVVNVNGQSDKERIDAFVRAMSGGAEVKAKRGP